MDQIICGGCRMLLMYARGASSVRCLCCQTINLTINPIAMVHCGNCRTSLMYPSGAPSVKCAICQFITNVGISSHVPYGAYNSSPSMSMAPSDSQTVVVQNPTSFDQSGKPVNNIVVGVTTKQK